MISLIFIIIGVIALISLTIFIAWAFSDMQKNMGFAIAMIFLVMIVGFTILPLFRL